MCKHLNKALTERELLQVMRTIRPKKCAPHLLLCRKRSSKSLGLPKQKIKAFSNIAIKNVTPNVNSSSSFTFNVTYSPASSQVGRNKRAKKVLGKLPRL